MAEIINAQVSRFVNESIRPISESIRALYYAADDCKRKWDGEVAQAIASADFADTVVDGRASQGVSVLSKNDITLTMVQVNAILDVLNGVGVMNVIQKPCVRPIEVR